MRIRTWLSFVMLAAVMGCAQNYSDVAGPPASIAASPAQQVQPVAQPEPSVSERLGTQWGEGISSNVTNVDLRRISNQPVEVVEIHYSGARQRGHTIREALVANGRVGVSVLDENDRRWELTKNGRNLYLRGREGERYQLYYQNYSQNTYEIVATVDGLDVLDGSAGSLSNRGYVLSPNSTLRIEGFRRSRNEVAAFRFSAPRDSYAANSDRGSVRNVGVIGTAIFELSDPRSYPDSRDAPRSFPGDNSYAPPPKYRRY